MYHRIGESLPILYEPNTTLGSGFYVNVHGIIVFVSEREIRESKTLPYHIAMRKASRGQRILPVCLDRNFHNRISDLLVRS